MITNQTIKKLMALLLFFNFLCAYACEPIILAHDTNLNFPINDRVWQAFFNQYCVQLKPYQDIDKLIQDLKQHQVTAAFIPAGTYYYFRDDAHYQGLASATLGKEKSVEETSVLLVKKDNANTLPVQLKHKTWAYINDGCTTSYFAPMLYLAEHQKSPQDYFKKRIVVNGFQAQADAMEQNNSIDATMLWSVFLEKNTSLQKNTRKIGVIRGLPTPVMIINTASADKFKQAFKEQLLHYQANNTWLYSGFTDYQQKQNLDFWHRITRVKPPNLY